MLGRIQMATRTTMDVPAQRFAVLPAIDRNDSEPADQFAGRGGFPAQEQPVIKRPDGQRDGDGDQLVPE